MLTPVLLAMAGCDARFQNVCTSVKIKNEQVKIGIVDSVKLLDVVSDGAVVSHAYKCTELCFSIIFKTGLPVLIDVPRPIEVSTLEVGEDRSFYDFLHVPGSYEYTFKRTAVCLERASHLDDVEGEFYGKFSGNFVNECIMVKMAAAYKNTINIDKVEGYVYEHNALPFSAFKDINADPYYLYKSNKLVGTLVDVYYLYPMGPAARTCYNHTVQRRKEFRDLIIRTINRGRAQS